MKETASDVKLPTWGGSQAKFTDTPASGLVSAPGSDNPNSRAPVRQWKRYDLAVHAMLAADVDDHSANLPAVADWGSYFKGDGRTGPPGFSSRSRGVVGEIDRDTADMAA